MAAYGSPGFLTNADITSAHEENQHSESNGTLHGGDRPVGPVAGNGGCPRYQ